MPVPPTESFLLPVLKALSRGEQTPVAEIRERVAAELNVAASERQEAGPSRNYPKFNNYIAHALKRLRSTGGGAGFLTGGNGEYRLTADGAHLLARNPRTLTYDDLKKNRRSKYRIEADQPGIGRAPADSGLDLVEAWGLAGKRLAEDESAPKRIDDRRAMLEEVKAWPQSERSSPEFMDLLWNDQRVLGHMGHGEYDLTTAINDERFRAKVATAVSTPLPEDRDERVKALEQVAENLMDLVRPHTVRVSGSGKRDKPIIQTWRLMTAVFPHDLLGAQASGVNPDYDLVVLFRELGGKWASTAAKHRWLLDRLAEVADPGSGFSPNDDLGAVARRMEQVQALYEIVSDAERQPDVQPEPPASYSTAQALDGLFVSKRRFLEILDGLKRQKNLILQGPPGVGKTFIAKRIAWCIIRRKDDNPIEVVQFHQSYAYEDFVQGFRPTKRGGFRRRNGVFFQFCKRAERDLKTPHIFIIDEINRGNLSRIFGELLMLLEADKRGPRHSVRLTYQDANESFSVPKNVYILGLMNTADRSLAVVDYALRRRFAFEELEPQFDRNFQAYLRDAGVAPDLIDRIVRDMESLNKKIRDDEDLGHGFEVGHSYFVPNGNETADENWRRHRVRSQILPLLREYWFDRKGDIKAWKEQLLAPPDGD